MRYGQKDVVGQRSLIVGAVLGSFVLYAATLPLIAWLAGQPAALALAWDPHASYPDWSRAFVLLFGLAGVSVALIAPGLAWAQVLAGSRLRAAALFHRAFVLNLVQATVFISLCKWSTGSVPSRFVFLAWQAFVAATGVMVLRRTRLRSAVGPVDSVRPVLSGALWLLLIVPAWLWGKTFMEDASGDGTEAFEFARSLATHQLPYWDLENDFYGFYPQFMLFAYPTQLCFITIGTSEAAQRIPVFFYLYGSYLVLVELVRGRQRKLAWAEISLLLGAATLFLIYHGYHSTYELVSDLAEPMGVDTFFTFLALSASYALITRQRVWWAVLALCGCMSLAAGMPFALLFLSGRALAARPRLSLHAWRSHVLDASGFFVALLAYKIFVRVYSHFNPMGVTKWDLNNLLNTYALEPQWGLVFAMLGKLAVVVAVVPLLGIALALRADKIVRMFAVTLLGYFALLVVFGRDNPHYLNPLSLLPAAMFLRAVAARGFLTARARTTAYAVYGAALVSLTLLVVPRDRTPHTAYREFGTRTLLRFDSYPAVVSAVASLLERRPNLFLHLPTGKAALPWQQVELDLLPDVPTLDLALDELLRAPAADGTAAELRGMSYHIFVRYSDWAPRAGVDYHQVLATRELAPAQWPGLVRTNLDDGWVLFLRAERSIFSAMTTVSTTR